MSNKLDKEEQEILGSFENDEWVSVSSPSDIAKYKAIAKSTFKKDKRVNIRLSETEIVKVVVASTGNFKRLFCPQ